MSEKLITTVRLPEFEHLYTVRKIVIEGYRKTGNKFWITFQGSKGYLSNITIECEGFQRKPNNRIFVELLHDKDGGFKNVMVKIYHSPENGVRVAVEDGAAEVCKGGISKIEHASMGPVGELDDLPY
jgi:hypothetical protein